MLCSANRASGVDLYEPVTLGSKTIQRDSSDCGVPQLLSLATEYLIPKGPRYWILTCAIFTPESEQAAVPSYK